MIIDKNVELYDLIHKHPLFAGTTDDEFLEMLQECELKFYRKADRVLYAKTERQGLLLILKGIAEVFVSGENDKKEILEILQANEMIGFSGLAHFLGEPVDPAHSLTVEVEAAEDLHCLEIPYTILRKRWGDEEVREFFLRKVAVRLRDLYTSRVRQF